MTHDTKVRSAFQAMMCRMMMACIALTVMSASSEAGLFYDFVEDGTGNVLATLELSSLPATHTEVVGLTFTPAGEAIFGLGPTYTGIFDNSFPTGGSLVDDGSGGLKGEPNLVDIVDFDPPESDPNPLTPPLSQLVIRVPSDSNLNQLDAIMDNLNDDLREVQAVGQFHFVPEPTSFALFLTAVLCGGGMGRGNARRCG
jgi:hypothetical protein